MFRSVAAVLGGLLTMIVLVAAATMASVALMGGGAAAGGMPANPGSAYLAVNLVYSFAAAVAGGWLTARLAPSRPRLHVAVLAALMAMLSAVSMSQQQSAGASAQQSSGYLWTVAVLGILGVFLGGWLRTRGRGAGLSTPAV